MSHIVREQFFVLMPDTTLGGKGHGVVLENITTLRSLKLQKSSGAGLKRDASWVEGRGI